MLKTVILLVTYEAGLVYVHLTGGVTYVPTGTLYGFEKMAIFCKEMTVTIDVYTHHNSSFKQGLLKNTDLICFNIFFMLSCVRNFYLGLCKSCPNIIFAGASNHHCSFSRKNIDFIIINRAIGLMCWMFTNGPGDGDSVPGQVISKTQKWYLMAPC